MTISLLTPSATLNPYKARVYLLSAGFSLTFGSMFAKTYRVHRIFTNSWAGICRDKMLKDTKLISMVCCLLLVDALVVTFWTLRWDIELFINVPLILTWFVQATPWSDTWRIWPLKSAWQIARWYTNRKWVNLRYYNDLNQLRFWYLFSSVWKEHERKLPSINQTEIF